MVVFFRDFLVFFFGVVDDICIGSCVGVIRFRLFCCCKNNWCCCCCFVCCCWVCFLVCVCREVRVCIEDVMFVDVGGEFIFEGKDIWFKFGEGDVFGELILLGERDCK